ncbi:secreted RxLR effector protein 161-like [Apium graveolens]|uniref:secreted RxLR effector protein 161-like n=1 Tax=Apium graveolens TaxID=4045 RepID=UPI003D7AD22B
MHPKEIITKDEGGKLVDSTDFKSIIGGLRYLIHTRPDLAYSVGVIRRFMEKPTVMHLNAAKRVLRYVKGTLEFGLIYTNDEENDVIIGYSDSDLAGNLEDRKSTDGMVFYLNKSLITWNSQKQRCVALSSCEAEFMAATAASYQAIWLRKLLAQVTGQYIPPVMLFIDNKSAINLAKNPVFHGRSKHIDVKFHFIRECIENGDIIVKHVCSEEQRADSLTKALSVVNFEKMRSILGVKRCVQTSLN